ncbi:MAG: hypothetical protein NDJ65_04300 [Paludibacteraceae bacterium]|nr:hypothetical protein [Paludibacteraceae bacterium]
MAQLNRYDFAYKFITMNLDYTKDDIGKRLPLMADKDFLMTLVEKMELQLEGFSWNDFSVTIEDLGDDFIAIFYEFPKPKEEPEALYGAILFDRCWETLTYYTLEMCSHKGRWALGRNTSNLHALMGMYDMEPTKENFLKMIIPSSTEKINVDIKSLLHLPDKFKELEKKPGDPDGCVTYGMSTELCNAIVQILPIRERKAMPFDDNVTIINGIHHSLKDEQALIEVENGKTKAGRLFVYSIVKSKLNESGVVYFLLMHVAYESGAISINAHFMEKGMTGYRDAAIWDLACREGVVSVENQDNWWFDPYDKDFRHPFLMNLSEKEEFDEAFIEHPLTQARQFVKLIMDKL